MKSITTCSTFPYVSNEDVTNERTKRQTFGKISIFSETKEKQNSIEIEQLQFGIHQTVFLTFNFKMFL